MATLSLSTPNGWLSLLTPSTATSDRSTFSFNSSRSPISQKKYNICGCLITSFVLYFMISIFVSSRIWIWSEPTKNTLNKSVVSSINNISDDSDGSESDESFSSWPMINKLDTNKAKCDAIFGNAFSKEIIQCSAINETVSHFECFQNPISNAMYCSAKNIIIDPKYIKVSKGGEPITDVIGRREDDEFPIYGYGAFNIGCDMDENIVIPRKDPVSFYLWDIIQNIKSSDNRRYNDLYNGYCHKNKNGSYIKTIVLLTMRYEYANIYHTATDWYNMYQVIRSLDIHPDKEDMKIIWLDGHSQGALDTAWNFAFGEKIFVKQLNDITCLREAIFIPAGYTGGISLQSMEKFGCTESVKYVGEFKNWFTRNIVTDGEIINVNNTIRISIICRMKYLSHPRNQNQETTRMFQDDEMMENLVRKAVSQKKRDGHYTHLNIEVERVYLEKMKIKEQFLKMMETNILIGVHGAGLAHLLFLKPNSTIIEIMTPSKQGNEHYKHLSSWCGHNYIRMESKEYNGFVQPNQHALTNTVVNAIHLQIRNN